MPRSALALSKTKHTGLLLYYLGISTYYVHDCNESSPPSFVLRRDSRSSLDEVVPGCFVPHELLGLVWIEICVSGGGVSEAHFPPPGGFQKTRCDIG